MNDLDHRDHLETVCAELIDAELDAVSGAVSDLGKYITKAVERTRSNGGRRRG